jgi:sugar O-acyltransferase (sialic acid O-acetyltransferase NeuD family)
MLLVRIPLMNANDDEVQVTHVAVREGDQVRAGDLLCVIESTKAAMDVEAPSPGFVRQLAVSKGQRAAVGTVICALVATSEERVDSTVANAAPDSAARATRKARELAEAHGIKLDELNIAGLIKEEDVQRFIAANSKSRRAPSALLSCAPGTKPLLLFGAGGHAKVIIDLVRPSSKEWSIIGAVDDSPLAEEVLGIPVLGSSADLQRLRREGIEHAALAIGSVQNHPQRQKLYEKLVAVGLKIPNLVHHRAIVEPSVQMGHGNQIFAGAIVGSAARLGDNTIINSGVVVSHDCEIGSHSHLAPGCILAGGVRVGENTLVGMGVTVYLGVTIGRNVMIANGTHVMKDVADGETVRAAAHGGAE